MATNLLKLARFSATGRSWTNSDFRKALAFYDNADPKPGNPIDLSGISFYTQQRASAASPSVFTNCSTDNGLLIVGGDGNNVLGWAIPKLIMGRLPGSEAGIVYLADVIATDGIDTVNIGSTTVTHYLGFTRL